METRTGISNNTLGVIIGLVVSVWWIFMGLESGFSFHASDPVSYWLTLGERRRTIMTIVALMLIPVCALEKRPAFLAAIVLGAVTLILSSIHVLYMWIAATSGFKAKLFGPIVWSILQIPIMVFGYRARRSLGKEAPIEGIVWN